MKFDGCLENLLRASPRAPAVALGLILLSACNAGPNYRPATPAELKVPEQFQAAATITAEQDMVDLARWWESFEDPVLSQLIDRAFAGNLDVSAASARLRQARATATFSRY